MRSGVNSYSIMGTVGDFNGYPVNHGYTVNEMALNRYISVFDKAIDQYGRLFVFRIDLRFPVEFKLTPECESRLIERFIASFVAKVRHNRAIAKKLNKQAHDTVVRYCWTCEYTGEMPHYHFVFFLNRDAFNTLGKFNTQGNNLYSRLVEAWASALGIAAEEAAGLVHVTQGGSFHLDGKSECFQERKGQIVHNMSYLAKEETKQRGNGKHTFGASRK